MHHTHFPEIHSTQLYLKEHLEELKSLDPDILISTSRQSAGQGRNEKIWDFYSHSMAISFTFSPNPVPTLTPLETGLLACRFFGERFQFPLTIKWPNDLLLNQQKCGGILNQYIDPETVIAGIGINIGLPSKAKDHYKHGVNFLHSDELMAISQKDLAAQFYQYILSNRLSPETVIHSFENFCAHMNHEVEIDDDGKLHRGFFKGIGKHGEAQLEKAGKTESFFSSSLRIL